MKKEIGVWIDHRQAVIVTLLAHGEEEITHIASDMEKHVRFSGASQSGTPTDHNDSTEDKRDRRFEGHLDKYYDAVIALLYDADSILILGPGEAKGELHKRLEGHKAREGEGIVVVEATDKLTDGQIVAEVKRHFHVNPVRL